METIQCQTVQRWITGSVPDPISPQEEQRLEAHLQQCPACSRFAEETRSLMDLLRQDRLPEPEAPVWPDLSRRIMAEVRRTASKQDQIPWYRRIWGTPFGWPGYAWVTALLLLVLTPVIIYNMQNGGKIASPGSEFILSELRGEGTLEPLSSALESLSDSEAGRLEKKVVARISKEISEEDPAGSEEDLRWDVSNGLESLSAKELEILMKKLQTRESVGVKEERNNVA
jgi:hypothetical protein